MEILVFILLLAIFVLLFLLYKQNSALKNKFEQDKTEIRTEISKLRTIGELNVFQIYSKEIVTRKDPAIDGFWNTIFGWSFSKKQIAIIFEFEINFVYDLRSDAFVVRNLGDENYEISMPQCKYKYSIKDMKIYDEKSAKFMPFLLPDSLNGIFGPNFSEKDKNRLIDEAKAEVKELSLKIIGDLEGKIHKSASDTLEAIAKSFGAKAVKFEFNDNKNAIEKELKMDVIELKEAQ